MSYIIPGSLRASPPSSSAPISAQPLSNQDVKKIYGAAAFLCEIPSILLYPPPQPGKGIKFRVQDYDLIKQPYETPLQSFVDNCISSPIEYFFGKKIEISVQGIESGYKGDAQDDLSSLPDELIELLNMHHRYLKDDDAKKTALSKHFTDNLIPALNWHRVTYEGRAVGVICKMLIEILNVAVSRKYDAGDLSATTNQPEATELKKIKQWLKPNEGVEKMVERGHNHDENLHKILLPTNLVEEIVDIFARFSAIKIKLGKVEKKIQAGDKKKIAQYIQKKDSYKLTIEAHKNEIDEKKAELLQIYREYRLVSQRPRYVPKPSKPIHVKSYYPQHDRGSFPTWKDISSESLPCTSVFDNPVTGPVQPSSGHQAGPSPNDEQELYAKDEDSQFHDQHVHIFADEMEEIEIK